MSGGFSAVRVSERVWWVGAVDWSTRDFHGYLTSRGTTYNAYLIKAGKVTLVDTVKPPFLGEMMARISSVIPDGKVDCIISNHSEMDHSGSLAEAAKLLHPAKILASANGVKALQSHFHGAVEAAAVADGESLDLGGARATFIETKMIHWPDSMMTYLHDDRLLFSQDGFGMHLASGERFADELPGDVLLYEGAKYFANILMPLSPLIEKLLERVRKLNLPIEVIAPDHGPVWRRDVMRMPELYAAWAAQRPTRSAVVVFDTMWGSTDLMARAVAEGLAAGGSPARVCPLRASHRSDVATELLGAGALLVGSPTMNNQVFPTVADAMCYLEGLRPRNRLCAAFGSYGWSGEATKLLAAQLERMKMEKVCEPLRVNYVPDGSALAECRKLGETVAAKLRERCGA